MTTALLKTWFRYYGKLSAVAAVNALGNFAFVFTGAGVASASKLVDARDFSVSGILWTLAGTIAARVALAIYKNPIPEPTPPTP